MARRHDEREGGPRERGELATGADADDRMGVGVDVGNLAHDSDSGDDDGGSGAADGVADFADLSLIQADDALLDALGGTDPAVDGQLADQELSTLLLSWRRDVDGEPFDELVDVDTAAAVIAAARAPRRRHRLLVPLASAAAVLAIAFTGVGLVVRDARPGDPLWGLTRVLYSEHARSVEAAASVKADLDTARSLLAGGRIAEARVLLQRVESQLGVVNTEDGRNDLSARHESLVEALRTGTTPTVSTVPGTSSTPGGRSQPTTPVASTTPSAPSVPETSTPRPAPTTTTTPPPSTVPVPSSGNPTTVTSGGTSTQGPGATDGSRSSSETGGQSPNQGVQGGRGNGNTK
ncbi:anti-sigma-D factor RsdA [Streptoalloteichus hindustanus]|uniref:Anti-sigma-D factor RsdA to sigma factor binding region n=1 Tax=Streptoalloteichus hindustanus TaxID=2017 RepID=A0A1M4T927_STRHI|nr:anti-sigma-D factor RsdA [Streptoalloteichus hindustanus]SHE41062.1 Anti-sigma-D factor RsdA to sigma factor binding region [Streptoalloteichus hindustanus]